MARLIWTEPALQDLEQIGDYIALDVTSLQGLRFYTNGVASFSPGLV